MTDRFHGTADDFDPPADVPTGGHDLADLAAMGAETRAVGARLATHQTTGHPLVQSDLQGTPLGRHLSEIHQRLDTLHEVAGRIESDVAGIAARMVGRGGPPPTQGDAARRVWLETELANVRRRMDSRTGHVRVDGVDAPAPQWLPTSVDRTLSAMDRITRYDAEAVIGVALTENWPDELLDIDRVHALAITIAERLYGTATELAPVTDPTVFAQGLATTYLQAAANDPDEGACICGPRGDGTGDSGHDPDPQCPQHAPEPDGTWPR